MHPMQHCGIQTFDDITELRTQAKVLPNDANVSFSAEVKVFQVVLHHGRGNCVVSVSQNQAKIGIEPVLMRPGPETLTGTAAAHPGYVFKHSVSLDIEELCDLRSVKENIRNSHNLIRAVFTSARCDYGWHHPCFRVAEISSGER